MRRFMRWLRAVWDGRRDSSLRDELARQHMVQMALQVQIDRLDKTVLHMMRDIKAKL